MPNTQYNGTLNPTGGTVVAMASASAATTANVAVSNNNLATPANVQLVLVSIVSTPYTGTIQPNGAVSALTNQALAAGQMLVAIPSQPNVAVTATTT